MKKLFRTVPIILLSAALAGCFPSGPMLSGIESDAESAEQSAEENSSAESETSQAPRKEIKGLTVKYTVPEEYPKEARELVVKPKKFDPERVREVFFDDTDNVAVESYEKAGNMTAGERFVFYGESFILARHESEDDIIQSRNYIGAMYGYTDYNEYFPKKELSFPLEEAVKKTEDILSVLELSNVGAPEIYSITADAANFFLDEKHGEHIPWTEEDETYLITYSFNIENILLPRSGFILNGIGTDPSYAIFLITKDGVSYAMINGAPSGEYEKKDSVEIKVSAKEAEDILLSHLSKTYLKTPKIIYSMEPVYAAKQRLPEMILTPVWLFRCFAVYDETGVKTYVPEVYIVDPVSGILS